MEETPLLLLDLRLGRAPVRWNRAYAEADRDEMAHGVDHLLTVDYPDADRIVLVMDTLDTHDIASGRRPPP